MTTFKKYENQEYAGTFFFLSKEKEQEFQMADPEVKKTAMFLLEKCMKQSMRELVDDMIIKKIEELELRIKTLECK